MPTFRFRCVECGKEFDRFRWISKRNIKGTCPGCGSDTERIFHGGSKVEIWKPIVLDHIADQPMMFDSKRKLQKYCKKHGLSSGALL